MQAKPAVLVVEDNPDWFEAVQYSLGDDFDLVHAESLREAERWLRAKNFRLAIVDLNLKDYALGDPYDRSGYELIDDLSHMEILRDMSIVVLSRFDDAQELRRSFKDFHVYDFVSKQHFLDLPFRDLVNDAIAASYGGVDGTEWPSR